MALNVGTRLGHYSVTALIGEGGMGQVYRATDTQLGRNVASDPDLKQRFERGATPLGRPQPVRFGEVQKDDG